MKEAIATHHHSFPKQQLSTNQQHHFASIQSSIFVPIKLFLLLLPNSHENEGQLSTQDGQDHGLVTFVMFAE
jgi:hypothetical protein